MILSKGKRAKVFSFALTITLFSFCALTEAQQPTKKALIGYLGGTRSRNAAQFQRGLHDLGYVEGKNFVIEYRYAEGRLDQMADLAAELVRLKVDVIVTQGTPAALAAKKATKTIPIIVSGGTDPVATGLVSSLARPGGNITGVTIMNEELAGKRLELLKETSPKISRVGVLWNGQSGSRCCFQTDAVCGSRAKFTASIRSCKNRQRLTGCLRYSK